MRYLVTSLVAIGFGTLAWGGGGLLHWDATLIQNGLITYMDARGAIGIGVGALDGAAALLLFRTQVPSHRFGKPPSEMDDVR